jgi:hypothetical protein
MQQSGVMELKTEPQRVGVGPSEKNPPSSKGGQAKNLYTKRQKLESQLLSYFGLV